MNARFRNYKVKQAVISITDEALEAMVQQGLLETKTENGRQMYRLTEKGVAYQKAQTEEAMRNAQEKFNAEVKRRAGLQ